MQHLLQRFAAKMKGNSTGEVFSAVTRALSVQISSRTVGVSIRKTGSHGWVLFMLKNGSKIRSRKSF